MADQYKYKSDGFSAKMCKKDIQKLTLNLDYFR